MFDRRLDACHAASAGVLRIERPPFPLRKRRQRWGSGTRAGNVLLNLDLVKAPLALRGPMAYVFAPRYLRLQKPKEAAEFFRAARDAAPAGSRLRAWVSWLAGRGVSWGQPLQNSAADG